MCFFGVFGAYVVPVSAQENFGVPYGSGRIYSYYQQGYYWDSYIIELGWNMDKHAPASYSHQIEISLPDQSTMQVYVADEIGENLEPEEISAIGSLIAHLNEEEKKGIQMPWVRRISYVEEKEIPDAAREYYQTEDYMGFTLLFPFLDAETKEDYYQQIYDEDRVDFFNMTAEYMAKEDYRIYLEKAWESGSLSVFPAGAVFSRNFIRYDILRQIFCRNITVIIKISRRLTVRHGFNMLVFSHSLPSFQG